MPLEHAAWILGGFHIQQLRVKPQIGAPVFVIHHRADNVKAQEAPDGQFSASAGSVISQPQFLGSRLHAIPIPTPGGNGGALGTKQIRPALFLGRQLYQGFNLHGPAAFPIQQP